MLLSKTFPSFTSTILQVCRLFYNCHYIIIIKMNIYVYIYILILTYKYHLRYIDAYNMYVNVNNRL